MRLLNQEVQLVRAAQRGDETALTTLYNTHKTNIYSYIYRRVGNDRDVAREITSDVFVRMVDKLDSYQPRGKPFAAWLYTIAHHRVVDHYRRVGRLTTQPLSLELADHAPLPDEQVAVRYDIERITCAMDNLTELQRDVLAMRYIDERTVKETADLLGRNEGAIKTLTRRAIAAIQRQLRREVRYE